jgi:hypothetical protein
MCVFEIDSVFPNDDPRYAFLSKNKWHLKTYKLNKFKVMSQGLAMPMSEFPDITSYKIGDDVTKKLSITEYEPEMDAPEVEVTKSKYPTWLMRWKWFRKLVCRSKKEYKGFPKEVSKTDQERIQNQLFRLNDGVSYIATQKLDGQSTTFLLKKKKGMFKTKFEFIVCSRNLRLYAKDNSNYWNMAEKYQIENALRNMIGDREWICVQGETCGVGIQGNRLGLKDVDFYAFHLWYPTGMVEPEMGRKLCGAHGIKYVPILGEVKIPDNIDDALKLADGKSVVGNTDNLREGLVLYPVGKPENSFKIVSNEYLLHYGI